MFVLCSAVRTALCRATCDVQKCAGLSVDGGQKRQQELTALTGYLKTVVHLGGVQTPTPREIPKALQNRAKLNPILKNVKN